MDKNGALAKIANAVTGSTEIAEIMATIPIEQLKADCAKRIDGLAEGKAGSEQEFELADLIPASARDHFKKVGAALSRIAGPMFHTAGQKKSASMSFAELMSGERGGFCATADPNAEGKNSAMVSGA